jgi:hypothetical protein
LIASTAGLTVRLTYFDSRAEIGILRGQTHSYSTTPHFWLQLSNAEMILDLEANEVEVKVLISLASVTESTDISHPFAHFRGLRHPQDSKNDEGPIVEKLNPFRASVREVAPKPSYETAPR